MFAILFLDFHCLSFKLYGFPIHWWGRRGRDRMVVGFTTTCMISVYHTKVRSSNPAHGAVYSIQYYVIKFVSDLRQIGGFFPATPVSSTNKTDRYDIAELLLKVALNKIIPSPNFLYFERPCWRLLPKRVAIMNLISIFVILTFRVCSVIFRLL